MNDLKSDISMKQSLKEELEMKLSNSITIEKDTNEVVAEDDYSSKIEVDL